MKRGLGVIIARFQTHALTEAHKYLISQVATRSDRVAVLLGVAPVVGTKRNPMEFLLRERMVYEYLHARHGDKDCVVLPLLDCGENDTWTRRFDDLVDAISLGHRVTVYSGPDGAAPIYQYSGGKHPTQIIDNLGVHATDLREAIVPSYTEDFRAGVVYACEKRFPACHPTVDIAVIGADRIVLGQKFEDKGLWRLPGGFVEPTDRSFEDAAVRELAEECGILALPTQLKNCGSIRVNDWRYREGPEAIITTVFLLKGYEGFHKAGDDLDLAAWHDLEAARKLIHPVHEPLLELALKWAAP